jgi:hypothetical protein
MNAPTAERIVSAPAFEGWAIVELMGHRQRAGLVREVEIAGGKMLRVDIPTEDGDVTEFYGASALYSLRPCSEEIARDMSKGYRDPRPVRPVAYREREAPRQIEHHDDDPEPMF